ncbi:MAG: hypothetical protein PHN56_04380 [Candidatus Nanoarchaeia archaeon]|nr:hypothetical protein [Candidatus Nanoarchaeia archaeon]
MGKKQKELNIDSIITSEKNNMNIITGVLLILFGIFLTLDSLNILNFNLNHLMSISGLIFLVSYFVTKRSGLLIPGVMLSLFSLIIFFKITNLPYLWLLSISLSFLAVYITKEKHTSWALIPGSILLAITIITIFQFYCSINAFPLILIFTGAYLLYKNYKRGKK